METFRYPKRFKLMTAVSAIVFTTIGIALVAWADYNGVRHWGMFGLVFTMLALYVRSCLILFRRADDTVTVGSGGLIYRAPGQPPVSLAWANVHTRSHDRQMRLDIVDRSGGYRKTITLGYQIQDFGRLIQLVRDRAVPSAGAAAQRAFVRAIGEIIGPFVWALAVLSMTLWLLRRGQVGPAVLTACGIPWLVGGVLVKPWRVRLLDDALALDYLVIRRRIPFAQISDVRLHEVKEFGKGRRRLHDMQAVDVVIGDRRLRLAGFRDGSLALYRALEDRWRAATGR